MSIQSLGGAIASNLRDAELAKLALTLLYPYYIICLYNAS